MKLDKALKQYFLQQVEGSNKTRSEFDLLALCDKRKHTFGEPASEKRRACQRFFDQCKRKVRRSLSMHCLDIVLISLISAADSKVLLKIS